MGFLSKYFTSIVRLHGWNCRRSFDLIYLYLLEGRFAGAYDIFYLTISRICNGAFPASLNLFLSSHKKTCIDTSNSLWKIEIHKIIVIYILTSGSTSTMEHR